MRGKTIYLSSVSRPRARQTSFQYGMVFRLSSAQWRARYTWIRSHTRVEVYDIRRIYGYTRVWRYKWYIRIYEYYIGNVCIWRARRTYTCLHNSVVVIQCIKVAFDWISSKFSAQWHSRELRIKRKRTCVCVGMYIIYFKVYEYYIFRLLVTAFSRRRTQGRTSQSKTPPSTLRTVVVGWRPLIVPGGRTMDRGSRSSSILVCIPQV